MGDHGPVTQQPLPAHDGETAGRAGPGTGGICGPEGELLAEALTPTISRLSQRALNCRLAERDTFIITVIQNAMMEGRIQKTTAAGEATVESLDPDMVTKLLHYLDLSGSVSCSDHRASRGL